MTPNSSFHLNENVWEASVGVSVESLDPLVAKLSVMIPPASISRS